MNDPHTGPSAAPPPDSAANSGDGSDRAGSASDDLLLLGISRRDADALATLYDQYGELVFTLAQRVVGNRDQAEQVMQDVFLHCWDGLERYDPSRGTLPAWLLGITRHGAIDVLRARQSQAPLPEDGPLPDPGERETETLGRADEVMVRTTVSQALTELPKPQRIAIELAYYGGLTQAQVAERLGEPFKHIKTWIRDGVGQLRSALSPLVDLSAADRGEAS